MQNYYAELHLFLIVSPWIGPLQVRDGFHFLFMMFLGPLESNFIHAKPLLKWFRIFQLLGGFEMGLCAAEHILGTVYIFWAYFVGALAYVGLLLLGLYKLDLTYFFFF